MLSRIASVSSAFLVAVFLVGVVGVQADAPPLWGPLEPGSHDVGFRRLWELDESRVWPRSPSLDSLEGSVARPVRVDVWYPADCDSDERMPLGDYVMMDAPSAPFEDLVFLTRRWDRYSYKGLAEDDEGFDRLMAARTAACPDAPASPGRFPLVVYSAGWFNRAPDNTLLAEFLASHGFVVAAIPQSNPGLWTYDFRSDASSIENQVRDLEVALGALAAESAVDRRRIAAMGHSTGGDVALLLQGRNPHIDAVVGLDASWTLGPENDVANSAFFAPEHHRVPILIARRPTAGRAGADDVLTSLVGAPRIVAEIPGGDHGSFGDDPAQRYFLGNGTAEHRATQIEAAKTVLEFLRRTLLGTATFDGESLLESYRSRGLVTSFLEALPTPTEENED
jgi:predicted dienelactone hydrolase